MMRRDASCRDLVQPFNTCKGRKLQSNERGVQFVVNGLCKHNLSAVDIILTFTAFAANNAVEHEVNDGCGSTSEKLV